MNINTDNMTIFYLTLSILALAGAILVVFGRTKEEKHRKGHVLPHVRILPKRESLPQTKSS